MTTQIGTRQEAEQFLAAHPEIQNIECVFTNISGVPRGKNLRRSELLPLYDSGRFLPGSILVCDVTGQDCEDTGLVWEDGDADRVAKPQAGTLVPCPWRGADTATVLLSMYELDGRENDLDPRVVLSRIIDRFKTLGLTPVVACELEFYLLDGPAAQDGEYIPFASQVTGHVADTHEVYGLREMHDVKPWLDDLYAMCDVQNIPVETCIAEYAPGQFELTLHHQADALLACDHAVLYKRTVKAVSVNHGAEATFMAKPFADIAGSGFHIHVSLNDANGNNIFTDENPEGSVELRQAVAGMKALLADSMAIFAPNANSFRRFKANSYAPVAPTWGVNNRTVSFRVPAGGPKTRHIEHRCSGADANPYLAVAAVLAAVYHGMTNKLDPGPAVTGNGYAVAHESVEKFPSHWFAAVDLFAESALMKEYFGERFVKMFTTVKRTEQARFFEHVSELDFRWYFRNV